MVLARERVSKAASQRHQWPEPNLWFGSKCQPLSWQMPANRTGASQETMARLSECLTCARTAASPTSRLPIVTCTFCSIPSQAAAATQFTRVFSSETGFQKFCCFSTCLCPLPLVNTSGLRVPHCYDTEVHTVHATACYQLLAIGYYWPRGGFSDGAEFCTDGGHSEHMYLLKGKFTKYILWLHRAGTLKLWQTATSIGKV